uniref:Putative nucleolar protein n=1 Tax=Ixodes ricinus TaxID=34613 RepID=A0A0K8RLF9_IXORI
MTVTQEVHFAHHLAANEKVTRDRALRKLTRWIRAKSAREDTEFTEESLMKLWKGLFFCMWMSDKPFVQQDLANNIAGLIHCFAQRSQALLFIDTFFKTMAHEWFAIDRFRLEKFMMLVRRFFRQGLVLAYAGEWKDENIVEFCDTLKATALHPSRGDVPLGLKMHVVDIFLQELSRVHGGKLTSEQADLFLQPFFDILTDSPAGTLVEFVRNNVFFLMIDLDREAVELEQEGEVPNLDEEGEEKDSDEEEDTYDEHGRVMEKGESSQDLPAIPFDYERIANKLFECTKRHALKPANRLVITRLVKKYRSILQEGLLKPPPPDDDQGDIITDKEILV